MFSNDIQIEQYLDEKISSYNADIYNNDKFIMIEISHYYNLKKTLKTLLTNISKDGYKVNVIDIKTKHADFKLKILNKIYTVKLIQSDLDF